MENILVLHNSVCEDSAEEKQSAWQESYAGVLEEVKAVCGSLEKIGIDYQVESISRIEQLPQLLGRTPHRLVFNLVESLSGGIFDACYVPTVCRSFNKLCSGTDTAGLLLAQDKWRSKAIFRGSGIPCPDGVVVPAGEKFDSSNLPQGLYIVKPALTDASEGIDANSVAELSSPSLTRAIKCIHEQFGQPALVEQFIEGREINVSVLERNGRLMVLPIAEIDFSAFDAGKRRIVDYAAKWKTNSFEYNNTPRILPAKISSRLQSLIHSYTKDVFRVIGCQDYARVDFRLDENENVYVLEVNPNPDISPDAGFAAAVAAGGLSYEDFIKIVLDNVLERLNKDQG